MTQADKVIAAAERWIGYLEKRSNAHLSELTANHGSANYTIFAQHYKDRWGDNLQGQPWCAMFVSDMLYEGCGKEIVKHFAYCPFGVNWFKQQGRWLTSGPQRGDVIFFKDSSGVACHVGLVTEAGNGSVTTIEGNTSSASGVIANGGCVRKKTYSIGYSRILGYGRPAYESGTYQKQEAGKMKVLLISGHGGTPYDPGACGCGEKEAVLTRELALLVQSELKNVSGVEPVLYDQSFDAYKILKSGGSLPASGVDYVFEIHFNACVNDERGDGKITGTEVLVHTLEDGVGVEEAVCRRIAALGFTNRGVKRRSDLLVMNTVKKQYGISHALLETCFIDDADDMALYRKTKAQVAKAVAQGIAEGFGLTYIDTAASVPANSQESAGAAATCKTEAEKIMTAEEIRKLVIDTVAGMDVKTTAENAAKKVAQDVVQESFRRIYDNANPLYTSVEKVPEYWQDEVREMIKLGIIKGDGTNAISMRREALQAAIIAYRIIKETENNK